MITKNCGSVRTRLCALRMLVLLIACLSACIGHSDPEPPVRNRTEAITPPAVLASTPTGWSAGDFEVTDDGAATYTIPIEVPAGREGIEPELALSYHSRAPNSLVGVGWSLSGLSRIARCGKTIADDGTTAGILFDDTDPVCLDGQRLVLVRGTHGQNGAEYQIRNNGFAKIYLRGRLGDPNTTFQLREQDGPIVTYGAGTGYVRGRTANPAQNGALQPGPEVTYAWLLTRVEDRSGNFMTVSYGAQSFPDLSVETYPVQIAYTGHSSLGAGSRTVDFVFETRADPILQYVSGLALKTTRVLRRIVVNAGRRVRTYELTHVLSGATQRSMLNTVRECDGRGVCKPETKFFWTGAEPLDFGPSSYDDINTGMDAPGGWFGDGQLLTTADGGVRTADVDGDMFDDVLYADYDDTDYPWVLRLGRGDGRFGGPLVSGLPINRNAVFDPATLVPFDINYDGRMDFTSLNTTLTFDTYVRVGAMPSYIPAFRDVGRCVAPNQFIGFEDLDGDGVRDVIDGCPCDAGVCPSWTYRLHQGGFSGYAEPKLFGFSRAPENFRQQGIDYDGDGRADFLVRDGAETTYRRATIDTAGRPVVLATNLPYIAESHEFFIDVNGDGLKDLVRMRRPTVGLSIRINTGRGFGPEYGAVSTVSPAFRNVPYADAHVDFIRVTDLNKDGREDFLLLLPHTVDGVRAPAIAYVSDGAQFRVRHFGAAGAMSGYGAFSTTQLLDSNGDQIPDVIRLEGRRFFLKQSRAYLPDVLGYVSAQSRMTFVTHAPLSRQGVYTRRAACIYPQRCLGNEMYVVDYHNEQGVTFKHSYADGVFDLQGRGWLGFAEHVVREEGARPYTLETKFQHTFAQGGRMDEPAVNLPTYQLRSVLLPSGSRRVWATAYAYSKQTFRSARSYRTPLVWQELKEYEVNAWNGTATDLERFNPLRSIVANYQYDEFGNMTRSSEQYADGSRLVVSCSLDNRPTTDLYGLPTSCSVTSTLADGRYKSRTTGYVYDVLGRLTAEIAYSPAAVEELRTTYTRSSLGVVTRVASSQPAGYTRATSIAYDADSIYPARITNSLGHVEEVHYDSALGVLDARVDPNGVESQWQYDGFGHLRTEIDGTASRTNITYASLPGVYVRAQIRGADGSEASVDYDAYGRLIAERNRGLNGEWNVQQTDYDTYGRVIRADKPRRENGARVSETYAYDPLNRLTSVRYPDGSPDLQIGYNGDLVSYRGRAGNIRDVRLDALGRPARAWHWSGGDARILEYAYGPFGDMERVRDLDGTTWSYEYDARGRLVAANDPDSGRTTYAYNVFDELVEEASPTGSVTRYARDLLGRVTQSTNGQTLIATFRWDSAPHGVGSLARAQTPDVTIDYTYDERGRVVSESHDASLALGYGYDAHGRLETIQYPSTPLGGLVVRNEYNAYGHLSRVLDGTTGSPYWSAFQSDGAGRITQERFGNAITTTRAYNAANGRLQSLTSVGASTDPLRQNGPTIQQLAYTYDTVGNVLRKNEQYTRRDEVFQYDGLNRLTTWTANGTRRGTYKYFANGNIASKNGTTYTYDAARQPHAVKGYDGATTAMSYDAAGRMERAGTRSITYTTFDLPRRITDPGKVTSFGYDAFQRRVFKSGGSGGTRYVGDLYERRQDGSTITHVFHVFGPERQVAQVVQRQASSGQPSARETYYLHDDGLGSLNVATNANATSLERFHFTPFGEPIDDSFNARQMTGPIRHGFSMHEHETDLGLINMRARMYDPKVGRFHTPDPIISDLFSRQGLNAYTYALNNPTTFNDPTGLDPCDMNAPCGGGNTGGGSGGGGPGSTRTGGGASSILYAPASFGTLARTARSFYVGRQHAVWFNWFLTPEEAGSAAGNEAFAAGQWVGAAEWVMFDVGSTLLTGGGATAVRTAAAGFARRAARAIATRGSVRGAAKVAVRATGQLHHAISRPVHAALQRHELLRGVYQARDARFVLRAADQAAHRGYQAWHRALDKEVVEWLGRNPTATSTQFESYLRGLYNRGDLVRRFPLGFQ